MIRALHDVKGAAVLAASLSFATPALAADPNGQFVIEGPGRLSCAAFVAPDVTDQTRRDVATWMSGYLTAQHYLLASTFDLTPWQTPSTVGALLTQYCRANPDNVVADGALELVRFLAPNRLQQQTEVVSIPNGSDVTILYLTVVQEARRALQELGYSAGESAEELAESVRAFQTDRGLPASGSLDQPTLLRLFQ